MSWQISCGFKNLDKLGVRIKKIKNTLLVGFFENQSKSNIFCKENPCKFYREFFSKFYRDFFNKIEGDFNLKGFLKLNGTRYRILVRFIFKGISQIKLNTISIFWWNFFWSYSALKGFCYVKLKANSQVWMFSFLKVVLK